MLQTKLLALSHAEVLAWQGMITNIKYKSDAITHPVSIRLSDFGTKLADFILRGNSVCGQHKLTLVFDDKIVSLEEYAISPLTAKSLGTRGLGIVFDLHEVQSEELARTIYMRLLLGGCKKKKYVINDLTDDILDSGERKWRMYHMVQAELRALRGR